MKTYTDVIKAIRFATLRRNEYYLRKKVAGISLKPTIRVTTFHEENLVISDKLFNNGNHQSIVKKEAVERFHPNNINNKDFWVECRKHFPLLSVSGNYCKNIREVNESTLKMAKDLGLISLLDNLTSNKVVNEKLKLLEIGYGYGNLFCEIKDTYDYVGIDYIIPECLKEYSNFIEIEKSGIPDYLLDEGYFDVVYCVNVLQHCSQKDRFEYFEQAYRALNHGGYMFFTLNIMTDKNKNDSYWGIVDENNRGYLHFFDQLTECDWDYELFDHLNKIGFITNDKNIAIIDNFMIGVIFKP